MVRCPLTAAEARAASADRRTNLAAQTPTSSQFLDEAVSFTGRSSCSDGEGIDRGESYREAIADALGGTTKGRLSGDDTMHAPGGQLFSMSLFEGQYSMPVVYR